MQHSYLDEYSTLGSPLHRLDPRVKIVVFLGFVLFIVFTRPDAYLAFGLYALFLGASIGFSRLPLRFVFKRSLNVIPFVLMIALFIPFLKKGEVMGAFSLGSLRLEITREGILIFWNILAKAYLSMLCVILLVSTTRFSRLLKAFEMLRLPQIFIMIMAFMYRYVFVLSDELMRMKQAKEARTVAGTRWFHTRALGNMLGVLFLRSYEKGEAVYFAMCARGYQGTVKTLDTFRIGPFDVVFLVSSLAAIVCVKIWAG